MRKILKADCQKCENLNVTRDGCLIYGNDPAVACRRCGLDCLKNFKDFTKK